MTRWGRSAVVMLASACLCVAAHAEPGAAPPAAEAVAPGIRGALALEPGRVRAGDVATLEIVVTTPPGHTLRPVVPPTELPGFWILDAQALPVEKQDGRWIHRTRIRLRARELGQYVWPAQPVDIDTPDGRTQHLVLDGRPLEVVSVQPDFPGRSVPFGLRDPAGAAPSPGSTWRAAAGGGLAGVAAVGLVALARRARRIRHESVSDRTNPSLSPEALPWRAALAALDGIAARLGGDPMAASDAVARALRRYVTLRYRRDVSALSTPELAAATPPPEAIRHWPELVAVLRNLDDARFPPRTPTEGERGDRAREALSQARAFVAATTPPGARG